MLSNGDDDDDVDVFSSFIFCLTFFIKIEFAGNNQLLTGVEMGKKGEWIQHWSIGLAVE
jgi:hypothetical protein